MKLTNRLEKFPYKVAVVTGASAGVGRALVRELATYKVKIGLIARGLNGLKAAQREVEALGGEAMILSLDVSDALAVEKAAGEVERKWGPIDLWINNAMLSVFSPVKEMLAEEYKRVTEVTYLGYVYGTLAALKSMTPQNRGHILQVGSALSYRSIPLQSAYCGAKHAVAGFTESLRTELLHDKSDIDLTVVQLPAVNTPQFSWVKSRLPNEPQPVPPVFQPEVIARAIVWAAKHPQREVIVGYPALKAIVGDKLAPGLADWYLAKTGYESQQTSEPVSSDRKNNLWAPIEEDRGAHGSFDNQSKNFSLQFWMQMHSGKIFAALGALFFAGWWVKIKVADSYAD